MFSTRSAGSSSTTRCWASTAMVLTPSSFSVTRIEPVSATPSGVRATGTATAPGAADGPADLGDHRADAAGLRKGLGQPPLQVGGRFGDGRAVEPRQGCGEQAGQIPSLVE